MKKMSSKIVLINLVSMMTFAIVVVGVIAINLANIGQTIFQELSTVLPEASIAIIEADAAFKDHLNSLVVKSFQEVMLVIPIALLIMLVATFYITRRMFKSLSELNKAVAYAQNGDLTQQIQCRGNDEIAALGKGFNVMIDSLYKMTKDVIGLSDKLTSSFVEIESIAKEVAVGSKETANTAIVMADGVTEQVEATDAATEVISGIVTQLNVMDVIMVEAKSQAAASLEAINHGQETIDLQNDKMMANQEASAKAGVAIQELSEVAKEIVEIVDVIEAISSQTNLLALNAAIEAARAGEAGRGFAVVAEEIRKLAEQTIDSTKKIGMIVESITGSVDVAVKQIGVAKKSVDDQAVALQESVASFDAISAAVKVIIDKIDVSAETTSQVNIASEVAKGDMMQIARISEDTALKTQKVMATTREQTAQIDMVNDYIVGVSELVGSLSESVDQFKV